MRNETYNGWKNRETWLVNMWYADTMLSIFTENEVYYVGADDVQTLAEDLIEAEVDLDSMKCGILADFIYGCLAEVDWFELAQHLNVTLADEYSELEK